VPALFPCNRVCSKGAVLPRVSRSKRPAKISIGIGNFQSIKLHFAP
jgi:hypothetical protein